MLLSIQELKKNTVDSSIEATIHAQVQLVTERITKTNKIYLELSINDAADQLSFNVWSNSPIFQQVQDLQAKSFIALNAHWEQNEYGINPKSISLQPLSPKDQQSLLSGADSIAESQQQDWADILKFVKNIQDPRLLEISSLFLKKYGEPLQRTAAAKKNHHARRGGLLEHVAQMMRSAHAIQKVYTKLNLDLLISGVLFHDSGKLWENSYPKDDFTQTITLEGELLSHIPIGLQIVNDLWLEISKKTEFNKWDTLTPSNELAKLHLLHLVASHHGQLEFGSPVYPKTPEAYALHYIDNLDAKYEMMTASYEKSLEIAPDVFLRQFPLPANLIKPLQHYSLDKKNKESQKPSLPDKPICDNLDENSHLEPFNGDLFL